MPSDRLLVGEYTVEVALREVLAPGRARARRITPKAMAVLLALVEDAGAVVTRDTLLAKVWPDTLPTNDVVTQAITQVRKAFGDDRENPRYIETISKSGYRLLAPVERLASPRVAASAQLDEPGYPAAAGRETAAVEEDARMPRAGGPRQHPRVVTAGAIAIMVLLVTMALWAKSLAPIRDTAAPAFPAPAALQPHRITSSPGFELAPSLSPDAAMVAFMAVPPGQQSIAILIQTTSPTVARQLTHPPAGADDGSPRWSPDGREIAFMRVRTGEGCSIMLIPANGGAERRIGACNPFSLSSFDWSPDGSGLVFSGRSVPGGRAGLQVLDISGGQWTPVDYAGDTTDFDLAPRYSPDGRWIVFVRNAPLGDFWRVPAAGGTAERLTHMNAEIRGWDWAPGGRALIYARRNAGESRLFRMELNSGGRTVDLGIADGEDPVVAANVPALAFVHRRSYFGIYQVGLDPADGGEATKKRLFASSGRDRLPSIAPDGRQLVFASDRSGDFGLWWSDLRQNSLRLLEGVRPETRHLATWSSDSSKLLVAGSYRDGEPGIIEVFPASGQATRLPIPLSGPVQALYLPSGQAAASHRLVVGGDAGGRTGLVLFDSGQRPWKRIAMIENVSVAQVDPAGQRVLFARSGGAGLWQADLGLSPRSVRRMDGPIQGAARYRAWAAAEDGAVYDVSRRADCPASLSRNGSGRPTQRHCLDPVQRASKTGFSIHERTGRAYVALVEWEGGDIDFVALDAGAGSSPPAARK